MRTLFGMPRRKRTAAQASAVAEKLRPMLGCLNRLHRRMETVGFLPDDLALVAKARDAMHESPAKLHYES